MSLPDLHLPLRVVHLGPDSNRLKTLHRGRLNLVSLDDGQNLDRGSS